MLEERKKVKYHVRVTEQTRNLHSDSIMCERENGILVDGMYETCTRLGIALTI